MMNTSPIEISKLIDLVIERAPALAAAGVTSLTVDGTLSITLAPPTGPTDLRGLQMPDTDEGAGPPPTHIDPMQDPSTYPGGRVPGFTRPPRSEE